MKPKNNMKNIFSNIGKTILCIALPLSASQGFLSSCSDYLYIKPLNEIVEENYWDRKEDVESILYGCYSGLQEADCLKRMFIWGEVRSENITYAAESSENELRQIIGENILETNKYVKWKDFYQVINRCNTLIEHAPDVQAIDPNYNVAEMKAHIAEAVWIRSLCYFYLARTFRDIPYTDKASSSDKDIEKDYALDPTPLQDVLKILAEDLEEVMEDVLRYYPLDGYSHAIYNPTNTSRVTKCAFYALLADIYLWQNNYEKVLVYTDKVFKYKNDLYEDAKLEDEDYVANLEMYFKKYPLYPQKYNSNTIGYAYNRIFGDGNSFESIFELYFYNNQSIENEIVKTFFGDPSKSSSQAGQFKAPSATCGGIYDGSNDRTPFKSCDYRPVMYASKTDKDYLIRKYYWDEVEVTATNLNNVEPPTSGYSSSKSFSNWIIYRTAEVMLMRAEALIEMGSTEQLAEAFELISALYNRGCVLKESDSKCLQADDYKTQETMRQLLRDERNRELMFEGKRWFDLVRFTLRQPDNNELINIVTAKQKERPTAVRIQLKSRDALFWPYEKTELDINKHLTQNSAYLTTETIEK